MRPHPHRAQIEELRTHPDAAVQEKARAILARMDIDPESIAREADRVMHCHNVTTAALGLIARVVRLRLIEGNAARRARFEELLARPAPKTTERAAELRPRH